MGEIAANVILLTVDGCGLTSSVTSSFVNYMHVFLIVVI